MIALIKKLLINKIASIIGSGNTNPTKIPTMTAKKTIGRPKKSTKRQS